MASVALCMIVKDGANTIRDALESAMETVDQIIVGVDSRTTDDTREVAADYADVLVDFDWTDHFANARNEIQQHATSDWILVIDADERLTDYSRAAILEAHTTPLEYGFTFVQENRDLDGNKIGSHVVQNIRLYPNSPDWKWVNRVHEQMTYQGDVNCRSIMKLNDIGVVHVGYSTENLPEKLARNKRLCELAIQDDPTDPWPHFNLARQYWFEGNPADTYWEVQRALEHREKLTDPAVDLLRNFAGL